MEMSGAVVSWCVVVSTSSYVRSAGERTDHQDGQMASSGGCVTLMPLLST